MGEFTRKNRMKRALQHEPVDRLPTQINYTAGMGKILAEHLNVPVNELPEVLDNHMVRLDLTFNARCSHDRSIRYDWWGAGHDTNEEGYFVAVHPLADNPDLDAYAWPDPHAGGLLDDALEKVKQYGDEFFITPNLGFALFERAWSLRGLQTFMMDMGLDPGYSHELLDRVAEIQLVLIHRYLEAGIDGAYFGDDYGAQKNLLFSPSMWREFIKPRLARLFAPFRERGLPILMHSDGQIQEILPDLVEIGLTALNPVQPEVLNLSWLYENFGGRLAFYGGISTQTVLPFGTPEAVRSAIQECRTKLAPEGTGLIIAPSHRMMTDIPMQNVDAMLEAFS